MKKTLIAGLLPVCGGLLHSQSSRESDDFNKAQQLLQRQPSSRASRP